MPSLLPHHFCLRGYEGCEIVGQTAEAGSGMSAFPDRALSDHELPRETDTFPKSAMTNHLIDDHARFGMRNQQHRLHSIEVLRENGHTDCDLVDRDRVLQNRLFRQVDDVVVGSTRSVKANA
jgi:hypothetical protein